MAGQSTLRALALGCMGVLTARGAPPGLYVRDSGMEVPIRQVALAENAPPRVRDAARHAARILGKVSGQAPPILELTATPGDLSGTLMLGECPGGNGAPAAELEQLGCGYVVVADGPNLRLRGVHPYYTYIGVFRFFQKLGAEFYVRPDTLERYFRERTDLVEAVPVGERLVVKTGWSEKPRFLNLDAGPHVARVRGTDGTMMTATHGMTPMLLPYERYAEDHPEYYTRHPAGGHEIGPGTAHLCLANPETLAIATTNLIAWMDACPAATYFDVGHADAPTWCRCEACEALGPPNERYMRFVNLLAAAAAAKHPDKRLMALAYSPFSEPPPQQHPPADNVVVTFCPYSWGGARSQAHPLEDPVNQVALGHFRGWLDLLGPRQMIGFEYTRIYPFPLYPNVMIDASIGNLRLYAAHPEVFAVTWAGLPYFSFADLHNYVIDRLVWDPEGDVAGWISGFMDAYYGPAAAFMKDYLKLLRETVRGKPHYQPAPYYAAGLLDDGLAESSYPCFRSAEEAVQDVEPFRTRVLIEKMHLLYVDLYERNLDNGKADLDRLAPKLQEFLRIMVHVAHPDRMAKTRSGTGIESWGRESRGQPPPHLWLRRIAGLRMENEDVYGSEVIAGLIAAEDAAAFIRAAQARVDDR